MTDIEMGHQGGVNGEPVKLTADKSIGLIKLEVKLLGIDDYLAREAAQAAATKTPEIPPTDALPPDDSAEK